MSVKDNAKQALTVVLLDDIFAAATTLATQYVAKPDEYPEVDATAFITLISAYNQEGWFHEARRRATLLSMRGGGNESSNVVDELENKGKLWADNSRKAVNTDILKEGLEITADRILALLKVRFPVTDNVTKLITSIHTAFTNAENALIPVGTTRLGAAPPAKWATTDGYDALPILRLFLGDKIRGDFGARKRRLILLHMLVDAVCSSSAKDARKDELYKVAVTWANERG